MRLRLHAAELDALLGLVNFDAVERAEKLEVPPGAAKLAVGRQLKPQLLLLLDIVLDLAVLDGLELGRSDGALFAFGACLPQRRGAQEAADMIGAERRLGPFHLYGSLGIYREQRHARRGGVNHKTMVGSVGGRVGHVPHPTNQAAQRRPLRRAPAAVTPR